MVLARHVAGVAALLRQLTPTASSATIGNTIEDTPAPMASGTVDSVGSRGVDAFAAANALAPTKLTAAATAKRRQNGPTSG